MQNWIAWSRSDFHIETVQHETDLFEIELFWHLTVHKQKL